MWVCFGPGGYITLRPALTMHWMSYTGQALIGVGQSDSTSIVKGIVTWGFGFPVVRECRW